jgi:hypothetical protein
MRAPSSKEGWRYLDLAVRRHCCCDQEQEFLARGRRGREVCHPLTAAAGSNPMMWAICRNPTAVTPMRTGFNLRNKLLRAKLRSNTPLSHLGTLATFLQQTPQVLILRRGGSDEKAEIDAVADRPLARSSSTLRPRDICYRRPTSGGQCRTAPVIRFDPNFGERQGPHAPAFRCPRRPAAAPRCVLMQQSGRRSRACTLPSPAPSHHLAGHQHDRQDERQGDHAEGKGKAGLHHGRRLLCQRSICESPNDPAAMTKAEAGSPISQATAKDISQSVSASQLRYRRRRRRTPERLRSRTGPIP